MSLKTKYKFIEFVKDERDDEKCVYVCKNKKCGAELGGTCYHGEWREFVFVPQEGCIFSHDCLTDIAHFLQELNVQ